MRRVALRGLVERKRRALTITIAVFLGVALMSGGFVLTDTINRSFEDIFDESTKGTDVTVRPHEEVEQFNGADPPAMKASLLQRVRRVDGVEAAQGGIFSLGRIVDLAGDPLGPEFAPNFIASAGAERFESFSYKGKKPRLSREAALDDQTAGKAGLRIGDYFVVVGEAGARQYRLVGVTKLGDTSFGGASVATLELPEAKLITGKVGKLDQISLAAEPGVSPETLERRVRQEMPRSVDVSTSTEDVKRATADIKDDLSFLTIALVVFAGVSLFVGAFVIFNTFSITVAQRVREFGLLRTLGASRRQVLGSVLLEAAIVGTIGSLLGLLGGIAFAPAINALFEYFGIDLPNTGTVVATRTIAVSLVAGMAVTFASALAPALRATRVSPMAALREAALPESRRRGRVLPILAAALVVAGLAVTSVGLFADIDDSGAAAGMMGGGAALVLLGVALLSPRLVRPLASAIGRPLEAVRGLLGRLARENAVRKPARTAATAAALMIGLALVTFITVFAEGFTGSVEAAIERQVAGDLVIENLNGFSPIPPGTERAAKSTRGVKTVSSRWYSTAKVEGVKGEQRLSGLNPKTASEVIRLDWEEGSRRTLDGLRRREAIVDAAWADKEGIVPGDRLHVKTPKGKEVAYRVRGSINDDADYTGTFLVTEDAIRRDFGETQPTQVFVAAERGERTKPLQRRLKGIVREYFPVAAVRNQAQLKRDQSEQIGQLVNLVYALLSLAVVVSLFGIVNTLALSIHERTRELGLLRAIGMSRSQVRTMVRYEAVITALIGALLGLALGVVFAALVSRPLEAEGFRLAYPVLELAVMLGLAALAGVLAAVMPARTASRLDVLQAVAYE